MVTSEALSFIRPQLVAKTDREHLAAVLVAARKEAGISQQKLGDRLGVGQKLISEIELGDRRVDFLELMALERALGVKQFVLMRQALSAIEADETGS